jgi:DNA polymerase III sliding clamp (beta) subunit (PCNA family)
MAMAKLSSFDVIPMILEIKGDHVVLSYDNKESMNWSLDFNSHPEQKPLRIPINGRYFADLLQASTMWEFAQPGEGKPIYFKSDDKLAVVMPMRE